MPKTIAQLESLLAGRGYACSRVLDMLVVSVKTDSYRNSAGDPSAQIFCRFGNDCLMVEIPFAFNAKKAVHKDVLYECLLVAAANTPLLKTQVDPRDGEVRLRIDYPCGEDGVREDDVMRAVRLLPTFADRWFDQVVRAMDDGAFAVPPNTVEKSRPADGERLGSIVRRAGGVNRLRVLLEYRRYLDGQNDVTNDPKKETNQDGHDLE